VTITGSYDTANEVMIRARTQDGRPGVWVVTPLVQDTGAAVLVVRGFLPTQGTLDAVPADAEPPSGEITVDGMVQATQTRGSFGGTDPADGHLTTMARVDVERVAQQVPYSLYPVWVQLQKQEPAQPGREPEALPPPELDDGPHLSYAVQWFIFSTIAIVGYPLILRRKARKGDETPADGDDDQAASREPEMSPAG
jgi:cytochrome oxidase assembly protein ShyY1